ncbi:jg13730 [Pararge aegeria aegeria]|uniref:Jg13730 protein n=1 Tax=Pararge aegeria aegeria TaxID=348720 RepID=A0A8S4RPP9_9NEOP|nr:jg13730 [Pararge aegeria aegeria]
MDHGGKRPRTVDCGTPYRRPMSSSGHQLVELMIVIPNHFTALRVKKLEPDLFLGSQGRSGVNPMGLCYEINTQRLKNTKKNQVWESSPQPWTQKAGSLPSAPILKLFVKGLNGRAKNQLPDATRRPSF